MALIGTLVGRLRKERISCSRRLSYLSVVTGSRARAPRRAVLRGSVCFVFQEVVGYGAVGSPAPFLSKDLTLQRIQVP